MSEAIQKHPELVKKYLGSVIPTTDHYFATLNSAVFTDGSFVYIPEGVRCPMELSTYFRINASETGQFERTLIIADKGSYVSYLEGCTAPMRDENQLHAANVELIALDDAEIKYNLAVKTLMYKPGVSFFELLQKDILIYIGKMSIFSSYRKLVARHFKNPFSCSIFFSGEFEIRDLHDNG